MDTITITEYLARKDIAYRESGNELITHCVFGECDKDSRPNEGHLYFNSQTSQYHCKKCDTQGNIVTLCKHLGDDLAEIRSDVGAVTSTPRQKKASTANTSLTPEYVASLHGALPERIREYLRKRGIPDAVTDQQQIGWGDFYGRSWITIPVTNAEGAYGSYAI